MRSAPSRRAVEWNADHDGQIFYRSKSNPPTGKETPFHVTIRRANALQILSSGEDFNYGRVRTLIVRSLCATKS